MDVLYVSSGNSLNGISPIVKNQGDSLVSEGIFINYFTIKGRGFFSYFRSIFQLRKYLKGNSFDIIHAHYSFSAYVASFAGANPLVVSLMGSDVKAKYWVKYFIHIFSFLFGWRQIIVKSEDMKNALGLKRCVIIPNGVNLEIFKPRERLMSQKALGWESTQKHILFAADPVRKEKNFKLVYQALSLNINPLVQLHYLKNVSYKDIPAYMNASDIVILSSNYEGSPNVIKEAMSCNCVIVATDVGDIKWVMGETNGCYIASFEPKDYADKLKLALRFNEETGGTNGRERIVSLGLDSKIIANNIIKIYRNIKVGNFYNL